MMTHRAKYPEYMGLTRELLLLKLDELTASLSISAPGHYEFSKRRDFIVEELALLEGRGG